MQNMNYNSKNYHQNANTQYQSNLGSAFQDDVGMNERDFERLNEHQQQGGSFKLPWTQYHDGHPNGAYAGNYTGMFYAPQQKGNHPRQPFMPANGMPMKSSMQRPNGIPYGSIPWQPVISSGNYPIMNLDQRYPNQNPVRHQKQPFVQHSSPPKQIEVKSPVPPPTFDAKDASIWPDLMMSGGDRKLTAPYQKTHKDQDEKTKEGDDTDGKDKMAWSHLLQEPGMALFNGQRSVGNGNPRQNKAERKNTNMEPKAWLYAWLGFRHIRPNYDWETVGDRPNQHFKCTLSAEGFERKGTGTAQSKKDAQTNAAWDFIDWLMTSKHLMNYEVEHVNTMKKKAKGIQDPIRSKPEEKKPDEAILIKEMEDMLSERKNLNLPQPAWVKGEHNFNATDEFWRRKDQISGNLTGDPAPTGGTGTTKTVEASIAVSLVKDGINPSSIIKSPRTQGQPEVTQVMASPRPPTVHTLLNPPPVIEHVRMPLQSIMPPPGAQPGSPYYPISADQSRSNHHYMLPPPPFMPPSGHPCYSMPPPPVPPFIQNYFEPPAPQVDDARANNLRGMLEDITKELEVESHLGVNLPCRNGTLEPSDVMILEHCHRISMTSEKKDILEKVTQICEKSLKSLSDALVRQAAEAANRHDLIDMLDDARNNNKVVILQRRKNEPTEEEMMLKNDLNSLRSVTSVIRIGALPMNNLLQNKMESEMVLFFKTPPTITLKSQILKLLPTCIDKTHNLGVEDGKASVLISGEILNEKVQCRMHFACKETTAEIPDDPLPIEFTSESLHRVRRANFWRNEALNAYSIMDRICKILIDLRSQENHILQSLSIWQMQLIIYYSINITPSSFNSSKLGPIDAFRRIFEFMSSGLICHQTLRDPVDPDVDDIMSTVSVQQKEELEKWAAESLHHIAFDQLDSVFPIVFEEESSDEVNPIESVQVVENVPTELSLSAPE